jgi:hypothetical protein
MGPDTIKPDQQTEAFVGWHGQSLYVGVRCMEPALGSLVAACLEDGEPTWNDDCVELFFDPGPSRSSFAQLVFNSKGVQFSKTARDEPWDARVPLATAKGDKQWRLEIAVPLQRIVTDRPEFGFNVARERKAGGDNELSCWRPTGGQFGNPSAFAHLRLDDAKGVAASVAKKVFEEGALRIRSADALALSDDYLTFDVEWTGDRAVLQRARLRISLLSGGKTIAQTHIPDPLAARLGAVVGLRNVAPGSYRLELSLIRPDGSPVSSAVATKDCLVLPRYLD